MLGTIVFGFDIVQGIKVSQLCRDAGHMYANGVDFSTTANQAILGRIGSGLGISAASGNGAVLLSTVTYITQSDCTSGGYSSCSNTNKYVFKSMTFYGNSTYAKSTLGLGGTNLTKIESGYVIKPADYLNDTSWIATNFTKFLTFPTTAAGQYAYVSEVFVKSQPLTWSSFTNTGSSARSFF